jgi:hypothetical protein
MCLLITIEKQWPSSEILKAGAHRNSDGAGIAWVEGDKVCYKKDVDMAEIESYRGRTPFMIHFRWATVGKDKRLIHPFPVSKKTGLKMAGTANAVLGHNGHWSDWGKAIINNAGWGLPLPNGPWSDTRAIAWLVSIHGLGFLQALNEKVAILDSKGNFYHAGSGWVERKGFNMSNDPLGWSYTSQYNTSNYKSTYGSACGVTTSTYSKSKTESEETQLIPEGEEETDDVICLRTYKGMSEDKTDENYSYCG